MSSGTLILAVVCRVGEPARVAAVEASYEALAAFVDGYLQVAYVQPGVELVCDEDGTFTRPFNRDVPALAPPLRPGLEGVLLATDPRLLPPGSSERGVHHVHGDFLLCGPDQTSLPSDLAFQLARTLNGGTP